MATEDAEVGVTPPEAVRAESDRLLAELEELRSLERRKREADISSPPFHDLSEAVERQARRVWRIAANEETLADRTEPSGMAVEDIDDEDGRDP